MLTCHIVLLLLGAVAQQLAAVFVRFFVLERRGGSTLVGSINSGSRGI